MKQFTDKSFSHAVKTTFDGISSRQDKIHELCLVAVAKGLDGSRDFGWLSIIANTFDQTKGLNTKLFSTWVKQSLTYITEQGERRAALEWQEDKKSFKLAAKGIEVLFMSTCKWYESEKNPTMASSYSVVAKLEHLLKSAQKKLKEGALSSDEAHLVSKLMSVYVEAKPAKPEVKLEGSASLTPADAAQAGVI